jgi:hypothetical protein
MARRTWGGKREGGGRKPLPPEEKTRSKMVAFRFSGADLEALEALAESADSTLGTVAKRLVLGALADAKKAETEKGSPPSSCQPTKATA